MKNLKLLYIQQRTNIEAEFFCHDHNGTIYFTSKEKLYCLEGGSNELALCEKFELHPVNDLIFPPLIGIEYIGDGELFVATAIGEFYIYDIYEKGITAYEVLSKKILTFSWSPDHLVVVVLTEDNSFILMTRTLDRLTEKSLCPDEFGESKPITVGWGSKETQFHGSEGKEAAKVKKVEPKPAHPYDDGQPRISWRSNENKYYFVTSSINKRKGFRELRIWSKDGILQSTGEIKDGLEEPVSWRPGGNIACSQQDAAKHKIIFFERNGLQHGEFVLPFKPNTYRVRDLLWNSDGSVLLILAELIEKPTFFHVMLWTCGNYHWYLKQSFCLQNITSAKSIFLKWSSLQTLELFFYHEATHDFYEGKWAWTISSSVSECDSAIVASIDNDNVLITPFAQMVVPPPMCAYSYNLPSSVQDVCFAPESPQFCCYIGNFKLALFTKGREDIQEEKQMSDCKIKLVAAGGNGFKTKVKPYSFLGILRLNIKGIETAEFSLCHWTWTKANKLLCICSYQNNKVLRFALISFDIPDTSLEEQELIGSHVVDLKCSVAGICTNKDGSVVAIQLANGLVFRLNSAESISEELLPWLCEDGSHLRLPEPCVTMSVISICEKDYFLGLSETWVLYCNKTVIIPKCTSYYIHDEYLLTTTKDHVLKFFLIDFDLSDLSKPHLDSNVQVQKIENDAKIIIAPHNDSKVILQMPRGNLETIHPRPLIFSYVCKHLDKLQFDKAFELSKVHRIDLNILYDHNPKVFLDNVGLVIDQLRSLTNLNLFLAGLKNEDVCETLYPLTYKGKIRPAKLNLENNKIDVICDSIREVIEAKKDSRLLLSLMATYAKKSEPELEEALIKLKGIKGLDPSSKANQALLDSALSFLLYLVDVNELIDVALGTYDLEITVMVAQKSQKDPKEFLPFYNELKFFDENYKKYKIDMHLRRYKKALIHISKCEEHFDECLSLIRDQRLYIESLYLFPPSSDRCKVVWKEYGHYLMEKRYFDEAGLVFSRCEDYEKALMSYKESLNWQSMLCAAMQLSYSDDKIIALCIEAADKLKSNQKYLEASYLLEQYVKDIEESIVTLIDGCEWNAALHLMSKYRRQDVSETHLKPALLDHCTYLESHIAQLSNDFRTHNERLKVVRIQKQKDAEFANIMKQYDEELFDEADSVVDGTSSAASSCAESKQISGSIMTRKSSKSRRKQKLKKYRLKEGSPDEDLAHIAALSEIVIKIDNLKDNFLNTLKAFVQFGYDEQAKFLQQEMCNLTSTVESEIPEIWRPSEANSQNSEVRFGPDSTANSIAAMLQSDRKNLTSYRTDPELAQPPWKKVDVLLHMFR